MRRAVEEVRFRQLLAPCVAWLGVADPVVASFYDRRHFCVLILVEPGYNADRRHGMCNDNRSLRERAAVHAQNHVGCGSSLCCSLDTKSHHQ